MYCGAEEREKLELRGGGRPTTSSNKHNHSEIITSHLVEILICGKLKPSNNKTDWNTIGGVSVCAGSATVAPVQPAALVLGGGAGSYIGAPRAVRVPAIYKLTGGWRQFLGLRGSAARGETVGPRHQSVFSHL